MASHLSGRQPSHRQLLRSPVRFWRAHFYIAHYAVTRVCFADGLVDAERTLVVSAVYSGYNLISRASVRDFPLLVTEVS